VRGGIPHKIVGVELLELGSESVLLSLNFDMMGVRVRGSWERERREGRRGRDDTDVDLGRCHPEMWECLRCV